MEYTKENIEELITMLLEDLLKSHKKDKINPSPILKNLESKGVSKNDLLNYFGVDRLIDVLSQMNNIQLTLDKHGTTYASFKTTSSEPIQDVDTSSTENTKEKATPMSMHNRIRIILSALNKGLYGKEEAIRLALLSAVAGESIFFLGPPGTAKSMISRRIHQAFVKESKYFEYLMNEFSTPDEIFGTIKLKGLDDGIYEKNTVGYLPQSNIAFLDEIWKSGPAILNTLLTIINEKKFHNGNKVETVPLQALISASNELPKEKAGLEALYDRFIIRTIVDYVNDEEDFKSLCEGDSEEIVIDEKILLNNAEIADWQKDIKAIKINDTIWDVILNVKKELIRKNQEQNRDPKEKFQVSDRRWKKIIHLLKTSAFLSGREEVDLMDCQLLTYCLWGTKKQLDEIKGIVEEVVQQHGIECTTAIDDIEEQLKNFKSVITATWYKMSDKKTHQEIISKKESDNRIYYKLQSNQYGYEWISKNTIDNDYYGRNYKRHYYIDMHGNKINIDYVEINENNFTMNVNHYQSYSIPLETKIIVDDKGGLVKNPELFNNAHVYEATMEKFDKEAYLPLMKNIETEISDLSAFKESVTQKCESNIFAQESFKNIIMTKIDKSMKALEDCKVKLEKLHKLYA